MTSTSSNMTSHVTSYNTTIETITQSVTQDISDSQLLVIKISSIAIATIGTLSNGTTIAAIIYGKLYKNDIFVKILHLLMCNLLHCVIFLPLITIQAYTGFWTDNVLICNAVSFGLYSNLGTELFGYVCISVNRYLCVVKKDLHKKLYGNIRILIVEWILSWLIYPTILALPLFGLFSRYQYAPKKLICHPFKGPDCEGYCLFVFLFALLTTLPVIAFSYISILIAYTKVQKRVANKRNQNKISTVSYPDRINLDRNTSSSSPKNSPRSARLRKVLSTRRKSEFKMTLTIMAIIILFVLCRLPFISLYILDPSVTKVDPLVHTVLIYIGSNLSWINPFIYAFSNTQIRRTLVKICKTLKNKHCPGICR